MSWPVDDETLAALARDPESELVERKESLTNKSRVCEAICAFANDIADRDQPGYVMIGVSDRGEPTGLHVTDELLREISDLRSNGALYPFPTMHVEKRQLDGVDIVLITVPPSDSTPIRFDGRVWVRIGPTTRRASPEEERRLTEKRRAGDLVFDRRPVPSSTLDDLDLDLFQRDYLPNAIAPDILAENQRPTLQQLASLRFATPDGTPTVAGIIVVGIEPTAFLPGAFVQFLRLDGDDLACPVKDEKRIDGPLPLQLRLIDEILRANIARSVDVTSGDRETVIPDYPLSALQQYVRNALMHRNYEGTAAPVRITWFSDRVEIQSPGGPYGQVTVERFGEPGLTDYRNPTIAEAMRALGYVQRFGIGLQLASRELSKNGNPPPTYDPHPENVLVVVRRRT